MKELKLSTKLGKKVYEMGCHCPWFGLNNLYDRWSQSKQIAYDKYWYEYSQDKNSTNFGIGNANSFGFTCSWLTSIDNEDVMIVKTKSNDYLVWLNR